MRLIYADALIKTIKREGLRSGNCGWSDDEIERDLFRMIDNEPTIEIEAIDKYGAENTGYELERRCDICRNNSVAVCVDKKTGYICEYFKGVAE